MIDLQGAERRITLRLLSYWEKLRKGRPMPMEEDISPDDIMDLWDNCFIIHISNLHKTDYNYTYLGKSIFNAYNHGLIKGDSGAMISPNASKLGMNSSKFLETGKPLLEDGEFPNISHEIVKFRQCLLPLGQGEKIEAIFGGMTFKIFPS